MSNFTILSPWPPILDAAQRAESGALSDPTGACFYARRALELMVNWMYDNDRDFRRPFEDHLTALLGTREFRETLPPALIAKTRVIKDLGNNAVHGRGTMRQGDAVMAVRELFHFAFWFARTYGKEKPKAGLAFDISVIPPANEAQLLRAAVAKAREALQQKEAELAERDRKLREAEEAKRNASEQLTQEVELLRAKVAERRETAATKPDSHDYSEAETRRYLIDLLLREAGWGTNGWTKGTDIEVPVTGMPNTKKTGYVDYVLWGANGLPVALVEAKRTSVDAEKGKQQAVLYADALEAEHGQRPIIYYSNGYTTWIWDDASYPPREVQGFHQRDELEQLIQRRRGASPLAAATINAVIVERFYQVEAIREIGKRLTARHRSALVVMATGAGKTRTVIALVDLLQRAGWVKRVLFLADRTALVNQAANAFKKHLASAGVVNLVTEREATGRVYVSTYPTMMNLIEEAREASDVRRFGVGHFDLVIIDEAHRSVYQKYGAIFDYFDSLLIGLTATPRNEVDRDTYKLFELQPGLPTYSYDLDQAVKDGFLVPPRAISVPLKFQREGIKYDDLSDEEKAEWDATDWGTEGETPTVVEPEALNSWLFNKDTVDKVLAHLMSHGQHVAGGDRLGKTIIFAKNKDHARFIEQRFDVNYPHLKGQFARVIYHGEPYAQQIIEDFGETEKAPHIAVSVDMLDTGIDVPDVVNLVFFKLVRSRTKFHQMIGRGTRLRPDLFSPGKHKEHFLIFDFCQNLEFFGTNPKGIDSAVQKSLSHRLFDQRLELHQVLVDSADPGASALRKSLGDALHTEVAAMNAENFLVRPHRRAVERFGKRDAWDQIDAEGYEQARRELAGLPSALPSEDESAKRFDHLMFRLEYALAKNTVAPGVEKQVRETARRIAEKKSVPAVAARLELVLEVAGDEWWEGVTIPMIEDARLKLRDLVQFIDRAHRHVVHTNFEDELGLGLVHEIPGLGSVDEATYRRRVQQFLERHADDLVLQKVKRNRPLTESDIKHLEELLGAAPDAPSRTDLTRVQGQDLPLGVFIRSLVGMDREAALQAFGRFLDGSRYSPNQIQFVSYIVEYLTKNGVMAPELLYEAPCTDFSPRGLDGMFVEEDASLIVALLREARDNAEGARSA